MDIAAGICAGQRAQGRVATVVYMGIQREGRSSMAIRIEAWALPNRLGDRVKVTDGLFTFVALDSVPSRCRSLAPFHRQVPGSERAEHD
jgi:acyl-CoA thioesterase YciA